jgi:hypothetical protein
MLTKREQGQETRLLMLAQQDADERDVALVSQALSLCPLPFRRVKGNQVERQTQVPGGHLTVTFTCVKKRGTLAYGNDALLLDLLCSEARVKKSPEITFKRAYELLELLGIKYDGGRDYAQLKERLERISTLHIHIERRGETALNLRVVDVQNLRTPSRKDIAKEKAGEHPILPYAIRLAPEFFNDLMSFYVPIPNEVLLTFKGNPTEYSLVKFIFHRMRVAKTDSLIGWEDLMLERGSADTNPDRFKLKVRNTLKKLQISWPELFNDIKAERKGLRMLKPKGVLV